MVNEGKSRLRVNERETRYRDLCQLEKEDMQIVLTAISALFDLHEVSFRFILYPTLSQLSPLPAQQIA